jgi:hypothetical protein
MQSLIDKSRDAIPAWKESHADARQWLDTVGSVATRAP